MEVSCIAIYLKTDYHKNVNRGKNTARTDGEAHGTEKESGCDHPRSIPGGDLTGQLEAGQALNLDDLAERYGVSRTPIQQSLKRMHTQGMVVFSSKGHFSVPTFSEKEVCDIIEMRLLLEHQALTDIQNKLLPMDFETLERLAGECVASNKTSNIVQTRRTDLDFHRILVEQAGNRCLSEVYDRIQGQFIVANYLLTSHTRSQQQVASDDHERLLAALKAGNFTRAHDIIEDHIQGACQKILAKMNA